MADVKELLRRACDATGLADFGETSFQEGLEILVKSATAEARHNEMGRGAFEGSVVNFLSQRLQVEDWYRRHPEIDEQDIVKPLIGIGLPRTGSTALAFLLAEDLNVRSLRTWESMNPCPPPTFETKDTDPRIAATQVSMDQRDILFPRMKIMLPSTATGPTECQTFMAYDFKSQIFQAMNRIPTYVEWLHHKADLVPTYKYVKRVLKLLQWKCPPNNWRLKNPSHSMFITAFDKVFPDARFVMTHRDVASVLPSVCDVYNEYTKAFSNDVDKHFIGAINTEFCELGMRRMIAFRDAGNDHRFFDIQFAPFQKDPYPALEKLYAFLGEEFTAETRARMQAWRDSSPRDKHGSHDYDPAAYGLDVAQIRERFKFYSDRFNVPLARI